MERYDKKSLIALAIVVALLSVFGLSLLDAPYGEICREEKNAAPKDCATYDISRYALFKTFAFLETYNGAVTALSTVFIAAFTYSLMVSTKRMWHVTNAGLKHAEDTAEIQLRAYVSVKTADMFFDQFDRVIWTNIQIENSGQTPAFHFTHWSEIEIGTDAEADSFFARIGKGTAESLLPANGAHLLHPATPVTDADMQDINAGRKRIYVWGNVEFTHAFDTQPRYFRFYCRNGVKATQQIGGKDLPGWVLDPAGKGYEAN